MAFNVLGFTLASALTRDLPDRDRANRLRLLGSLDYTGLLVADLIASESPDMDPLERLRLLGEAAEEARRVDEAEARERLIALLERELEELKASS